MQFDCPKSIIEMNHVWSEISNLTFFEIGIFPMKIGPGHNLGLSAVSQKCSLGYIYTIHQTIQRIVKEVHSPVCVGILNWIKSISLHKVG